MDVSAIRKDFPILRGKDPPIFFDSACTSLRPAQVLKAINDYYENYPSCGGRSIHKFGTRVTLEVDKTRKKIHRFLNSERAEEIVFVKNTTEAINMIASTLGFQEGDVVLSTDKEHNSNLVPWHELSRKKGVKYRIVRSNEDNTFSIENLKEMMSKKVKMVSMVHTSNLDGYTIPAKEIAQVVHDYGGLFMMDGAQSAPHFPVDVQDLDADFFACSIHKMCGPSGVGVLYGKYDLLEKLDTFMVGGDTVSDSRYEGCEILKPPHKFEAGLQNFSGIIGAGAAIDYLSDIGMDNIREHSQMLNRKATELLRDIPGVKILGPDVPERGAILPFNMEGLDPHDVAMILDEVANIMIRSGMHCVHSWFNAHGIKGCARASFYIYNNEKEVDIFGEQISKISEQFL
ncbi:MAG: aminotransferase class V-fold PLP-dependent enzyme [Thermoplasmata archaeon]